MASRQTEAEVDVNSPTKSTRQQKPSTPYPEVMGEARVNDKEKEKEKPQPITIVVQNNNPGVAPTGPTSNTCCGHCKNMWCSCWYGCEVFATNTALCCVLSWECTKKSSSDQSHCCKSCCGHWGVCCRETGLACYFCKG
jgi:hypothetical protein